MYQVLQTEHYVTPLTKKTNNKSNVYEIFWLFLVQKKLSEQIKYASNLEKPKDVNLIHFLIRFHVSNI